MKNIDATARVIPPRLTASRRNADHAKKLKLTEDIRKLLGQLEHWKQAPERVKELKRELDTKWEEFKALTPPTANTEPNNWMDLEAARNAEAPKVEAPKGKPGRPPTRRLRDDQVKDIVDRLTLGETQVSIARSYQCDPSTISDIAGRHGLRKSRTRT
jgi:hypothetical protein